MIERPDEASDEEPTQQPMRQPSEGSHERPDEDRDPVEPPTTGHEAADAALAALAGTRVEDVDGRIRTGEDVHHALRATLTELGG